MRDRAPERAPNLSMHDVLRDAVPEFVGSVAAALVLTACAYVARSVRVRRRRNRGTELAPHTPLPQQGAGSDGDEAA